MNWIKNSLLVVLSVALALIALEVGLRSVGSEQPAATGVASVGMYHPRLGWAPRPEASGQDAYGNTVTILPDGTRSNGDSPVQTRERPILVVGDSLVFGDEVNDHETWPAQLEKMLGRRVVNGGVNGYGIDQAVLRAEELIEELNPGLLLFGFYPDDIMRCGLSVRHQPKPFFELVEDSIRLANVPVPEIDKVSPGFLTELAAKSYLVKKLLPGFLKSSGDMGFVGAHYEHEQVSALLLKRISQVAQERSIPVVFVVQYNELSLETKERVDRVLYYVSQDGYSQTLNFYSLLKKIHDGTPGVFNNMFIQFNENGRSMIRHMNRQGNWFVAKNVRDYLKPK